MGWALRAGVVLVALAIGLGWVLTRPASLPDNFAADHIPDPENGALVFHAGGCASCHTAPEAETDGAAPPVLAGGLPFVTEFGTFYAPNISPHPDHGIGAWSAQGFARAVTLGVSPQGQHYYPAFPYAAYQHATPGDVADLFAYIQTLPPSDAVNRPHDVGFPFNIRRGLGLWKRLFVAKDFVVATDDPILQRGRYLAEGLSHCTECHTSRNALGGLDRARWMAGAPNPSGKGTIPNITPAVLDWSENDLIAYFTSGFTPDYDSAGGKMAEVVENLSQLPEADRAAIAAYIKALPAIP
ncbi:cytochrome c [uncultured Tateyamaria sp.]|uniref:c-type cytochrome n=1 Tax=uncultured Tateyamaria sp. TaxID=455651 RepID=UPI0026229FAE|nr:cytochrome c [uncultured Tateyamaria sp.]